MSSDTAADDPELGESESDDYDDDDDYDNYYNNNDDDLIDSADEVEESLEEQKGQGDTRDNNNVKKKIQDLEYIEYECLTLPEVDEKLESECAAFASKIKVTGPLAALVLQANKWQSGAVLKQAQTPNERLRILIKAGVQCAKAPKPISISSSRQLQECGVCLEPMPRQKLTWLPCTHAFCHDCWNKHVEFIVKDSMPAGVPCMAKECNLLCPSDLIEQFINNDPDLLARFKRRHRDACISSHHQLRFCPGADCPTVLYAAEPKARRVECNECHTSFCFECGLDYHSPTDCATIKRWLTKCSDDSETANYICANTKNCPACHICIEKNGGCNHVQCSKCKHDFCWMCLCDWKSHGNSYYVCSRYKENPLIAEQNMQVQAREALKKYLFYFERWENHSQSLQLEAEARKRIQKQIEEKVMKNEGTWIDWQYLLRAGELLAKCRSTLQNTYPLAYYSPPGAEKELFEYQQAQLELEIEELSWKLENAGSYQRGDIENQMDVAGKRRHTLLLHFLRD